MSLSSQPDYYKMLQVDSDAEQEVIEAAYRRLARKYHPDVYKGHDSNIRMRDLNLAFEVLGDPERRKAYDARRESAALRQKQSQWSSTAQSPTRPRTEYQREQPKQEPARPKQEPADTVHSQRTTSQDREPIYEVEPAARISRRMMLVLGFAGAGVIVTGIGLSWILTPHPLYSNFGHFASAAWSPNSKEIASVSRYNTDNTVIVWDAMTGTKHVTYTGHKSWVGSAIWSPNGKSIASGGGDKTVQVWDPITGKKRLTYTGHTGQIDSIAWSPDGKSIASGGSTIFASENGITIKKDIDNTVQVWDPITGKKRLTYTGHTGFGVHSVAWSPNGKEIASGGWGDGTVQVWDAMTGTKRATYPAGGDSVTWSPDGKSIASGYDNTVQVWDAMTGTKRLTYTGHSDFVSSVVWSPNGKYIASAGEGGEVEIWQAM